MPLIFAQPESFWHGEREDEVYASTQIELAFVGDLVVLNVLCSSIVSDWLETINFL